MLQTKQTGPSFGQHHDKITQTKEFVQTILRKSRKGVIIIY